MDHAEALRIKALRPDLWADVAAALGCNDVTTEEPGMKADDELRAEL